ncbi:MAG: tetratricopeptide repeat protein [Mariprofundaceae bacterium]|nr:tetratricopeptide repeat protein [Mariprofundaceae bacterium]
MMEQGFEHLQKEEFTEARRSFEAAVVAKPKNLEARYNLALLLKKSGHGDLELELYEKNMTYGWHLPTVVNLSSLYIADGKKAEAYRLLQRASKRFRSEAVPHYLLAELDAAAGNIDAADKWFSKALKADPLNGFAHIRYARFLAGQKRGKEALRHADRATRLLPDCAICLTILGDIQLQEASYDSAVASYQRSLAIEPLAATRQRLIDALHGLGEHERAEQMQKALDAWKKQR